jgi:hypothetical protein
MWFQYLCVDNGTNVEELVFVETTTEERAKKGLESYLDDSSFPELAADETKNYYLVAEFEVTSFKTHSYQHIEVVLLQERGEEWIRL